LLVRVREIHARKVLEPGKELVAIASLIGSGWKIPPAVAYHGGSASRLLEGEIIEVIIQSVVYVGFTRAMVALGLVREVSRTCQRYAERICKPPVLHSRTGERRQDREKTA